MSKLANCGICLLCSAILIGVILNNVSLFLFSTDIVWGILNYLDDSESDYTGNAYLNSKLYAPVNEERVDYNLKVIGNIPSECDGVIFKIGPNPIRKDVAVKYAWFDGDGMVHSIKLISKNNTAHYSNSFMHTIKYNVENEKNRSIYFNFFGPTHSNGWIGLIKMLFGGKFIRESKYSPVNLDNYRKNKNSSEGGNANTNILYWNHKLLALLEANTPFEFRYSSKTATIESVGYFDFNGSWKYPFTAHPKIDRNTNQLFTHGAYIQPNLDEVVMGMTSTDNPEILINSKKFKLRSGQMMHDMMITNKYILVFDLNLWIGRDIFKYTKATKVMAFENTTNSRIGIMERKELENKGKNAKIKWFDIKPCFVFHFVNAYDDNNNDEIVIIGNRFDYIDFNMFQFNTNNLEKSLKSMYPPTVYKWILNVKTGKVEERALFLNHNNQLIFGVINPLYLGNKNNHFVWMSSAYIHEHDAIVFNGIIKYDLQNEQIVNKIMYDTQDVGNSEFAVIKKNDNNNDDEDNVYLITIIYNRDTDKSRIEIYDGKSMKTKSIATVKLQSRVPIGFHSQFIPQKELDIMDQLHAK